MREATLVDYVTIETHKTNHQRSYYSALDHNVMLSLNNCMMKVQSLVVSLVNVVYISDCILRNLLVTSNALFASYNALSDLPSI